MEKDCDAHTRVKQNRPTTTENSRSFFVVVGRRKRDWKVDERVAAGAKHLVVERNNEEANEEEAALCASRVLLKPFRMPRQWR